MNKMQIAHEWYMKHGKDNVMEKSIACAWQYADAMQAEADRREKEEVEEESKNSKEVRQKFINTFEKHNLYCSEEWQPDWSQAPDDATAWEYLGHGAARWHTTTKGMYKSADLFDYSGAAMLLVERPQ